jgi:hypothetical protein
MTVLDLSRLRATPLAAAPYDHFIVPGFILPAARADVLRDFPEIERPGSFPLPSLRYGPAFAALVEELQGPDMTLAMEEKFGVSLRDRPTMVTVRGRAQARDGQIHTDSRTKLLTVLLYMNPAWESPDGRLRLLRRPDSLDDPVVEVPPEEGTLLAFRNGPEAWHGHTSVEGPRRSIQLNWVSDAGIVRREQFRHALSARIKRLNPFR